MTASNTRKIDHSVAVAGFPFPFPKETYRYSTNVEPASVPRATTAGSWGEHPVDIDHAYLGELAERASILSSDPSRLQCLPHMVPAAWDAMFVLMEELAAAYPQHMSLTREGGGWHWHNGLLGIDRCFAVGEASSMPEGPLGFIGQQVQEDIVLLDQRDGELWADAGLVTFAADWSFGFDVGMSFLEIHGPVPRVHDEGVIPRAQAFLMRLEPGQSYRRTNWTLTVDGKLDTSTETYPEWGPDRTALVDGPLAAVGDRLHLRTEVQHLIRLPESNAIMFLIRSYLLPFSALATVPAWAARTVEVLEDCLRTWPSTRACSELVRSASAGCGSSVASAREAPPGPRDENRCQQLLCSLAVMADAEQVSSERGSAQEHERGTEGPDAPGEQKAPTQQERAEATLRSIMAGGNLTAETMKLSNDFTDRQVSRLKALFRRTS